MKRTFVFSILILLARSLLAADSSAKDDVTKAAKALGEKPSYSWKTTIEVPEGAPFRPGPTEGRTEKGGPTGLTMSFGQGTTEAVLKGDKAAVNRDGQWQSLSEIENAEGPGRFLAAFLRGFQPPSDQAAEIVRQVKELKQDGETYSGELTEDGAKSLMRFRRRGGEGGPTVLSGKGSAKFWLKAGDLVKYEYKVDGSMDFNGNEVEVKRTTTVEIKDVGTTKVEVPEDAKAKLGA